MAAKELWSVQVTVGLGYGDGVLVLICSDEVDDVGNRSARNCTVEGEFYVIGIQSFTIVERQALADKEPIRSRGDYLPLLSNLGDNLAGYRVGVHECVKDVVGDCDSGGLLADVGIE